MMFAVNTWAIIMTTTSCVVTSGDLWITLQFIGDNAIAFLDNVTIAITSATGQLFIFYTIKTFGPIVFTIIMTTRQMFSIVLSTVIFGHAIKPLMGLGAVIVFATIFNRIKRQAAKRKQAGRWWRASTRHVGAACVSISSALLRSTRGLLASLVAAIRAAVARHGFSSGQRRGPHKLAAAPREGERR